MQRRLRALQKGYKSSRRFKISIKLYNTQLQAIVYRPGSALGQKVSAFVKDDNQARRAGAARDSITGPP